VKFNNKYSKVAIVMGSESDYPVMRNCEKILKTFGIKYETLIVSAHRTPDRLFEFAKKAFKDKFTVIIAGAGGAAHLPGMIASISILPVIGVPIESKKLKGLDSLLSTVMMPKGVPVATVAIDGATNAGILAASIIGTFNKNVRSNLEKWRRVQTQSIKKRPK
jgi:5-(carboxyamino)imidazole ribonucleotide mutase